MVKSGHLSNRWRRILFEYLKANMQSSECKFLWIFHRNFSARCFTMISTFYLLKVTKNYKNSFAFVKLTHKKSRGSGEMCEGIAGKKRKVFFHDIKIASQLLSNKKETPTTPPACDSVCSGHGGREERAINEFNMRNFIIFMWWGKQWVHLLC